MVHSEVEALNKINNENFISVIAFYVFVSLFVSLFFCLLICLGQRQLLGNSTL